MSHIGRTNRTCHAAISPANRSVVEDFDEWEGGCAHHGLNEPKVTTVLRIARAFKIGAAEPLRPFGEGKTMT